MADVVSSAFRKCLIISSQEDEHGWENFCLLQRSLGPFGPKVAERVRLSASGPKRPKWNRKRVNIERSERGGGVSKPGGFGKVLMVSGTPSGITTSYYALQNCFLSLEGKEGFIRSRNLYNL